MGPIVSVEDLWDTATVEIMLRNGQDAGKRRSASRLPKRSSRRRNNALATSAFDCPSISRLPARSIDSRPLRPKGRTATHYGCIYTHHRLDQGLKKLQKAKVKCRS